MQLRSPKPYRLSPTKKPARLRPKDNGIEQQDRTWRRGASRPATASAAYELPAKEVLAGIAFIQSATSYGLLLLLLQKPHCPCQA